MRMPASARIHLFLHVSYSALQGLCPACMQVGFPFQVPSLFSRNCSSTSSTQAPVQLLVMSNLDASYCQLRPATPMARSSSAVGPLLMLQPARFATCTDLPQLSCCYPYSPRMVINNQRKEEERASLSFGGQK